MIVMYFLSLHVQFSTNMILKYRKQIALVSKYIFKSNILIDFTFIVQVYVSGHYYQINNEMVQ